MRKLKDYKFEFFYDTTNGHMSKRGKNSEKKIV